MHAARETLRPAHASSGKRRAIRPHPKKSPGASTLRAAALLIPRMVTRSAGQSFTAPTAFGPDCSLRTSPLEDLT